MITTGVLRSAGFFRSACSIEAPPNIGIMKSSNTTSGVLSSARSNPCRPLAAVTTSWPTSTKIDSSTSATLNSSSTTRMSATLILTVTRIFR